MLYEFHRTSNARKSGAVHATYLLTGTRKAARRTNGLSSQGEDSFMADSSFMSSLPGQDEQEVKVTSITLVQEEELEGRWVLAPLGVARIGLTYHNSNQTAL